MSEKKESRTGVLISFLKFTPIIVFALLVIVYGLDLLVAAPMATFVALGVAMFVNRENFNQVFDRGIASAKEIVIVFFILMFAYAVAECFMATGVGASTINLALNFGVSAKTVAVTGYLVTCVLSLATGTSWGTFAACAPIFLWLNYIVGGNLVLTLGAIAGGSCFGDNIGFISDTTVLSSGLQGVDIFKKVKHQSVWVGLCVIITVIIISAVSFNYPVVVGDPAEAIASIPAESLIALQEERPAAVLLLQQVSDKVPVYMVIPLFVVIILAFTGLNTMICLGGGMISSLIFGLMAKTVTVDVWLNTLLLGGFSSAGSWSICMMMWVSAFGGIMNSMNAFAPLANLIARISTKVRHLMGWNGVLCLLGNVALADETAEIATISPIIRKITEDNVEASEEDMYVLRLRLATFAGTLGVHGSQLIPWHSFTVFFVAIANTVYPIHDFVPLDIIKMNIMSFVAVGSILILTFTGWDRFIPLFKLPAEPNVRLKKNI